MARRILITLGLLLVVLAGVAVYARATGWRLPGLPAPPLESSLASLAKRGDSLEVASFARRHCALLKDPDKRHCYEDIFLKLTESDHVRLAMGALNRLGTLDPDVVRLGHDYTHVVGINAWTLGKDLGKVYDSCTELFQSGCYHGVIQAYMSAMGTDSATVAGICGQIPSTSTSMWLRFQCVHGLGHGLVQTKGLRLPRALGGCDLLASGWDRESCYGGAFMEFILAARGQSHHPAAHGQHLHAHAAEPDTGPPFKVRDRSDPLYPCTALDRRYQQACYMMQAGIIIEITGPDFGKIARACDGAPLGMRETCYQGIGTYTSGFTVRNTPQAIKLCSMGSERYRPWCFVGVVKNYIDVTARAEDGLEFCRQLPDRGIATSCYVAVGQEISVLRSAPAEREAECAKTVAEYRPACRYGAQLTGDRPRDLPLGDVASASP